MDLVRSGEGVATPDVAKLVCPECGAPMALRQGRHGPFYGCTAWRETKCSGSHGAHPDGSPLGIPADRATKAARIRAHAAFDELWNSGRMSRTRAYTWMRKALGLSKREAHIGRFTIRQCERLIRAIEHREGT